MKKREILIQLSIIAVFVIFALGSAEMDDFNDGYNYGRSLREKQSNTQTPSDSTNVEDLLVEAEIPSVENGSNTALND